MENKQWKVIGAVVLVLIIGAVLFFVQKSQDGVLAGEARATGFSASEENCFRSSGCSTSYGNCIKLKCSGLGLAKDCKSKCLETSLKSVSVKEVPAYAYQKPTASAYQEPVAPASAESMENCMDSDVGYYKGTYDNDVNLYEYGVARKGATESSDYCDVDGKLVESYCLHNNNIASFKVDCINGCKNGACIPLTDCTDSDNTAPEELFYGKDSPSTMSRGTTVGPIPAGFSNEVVIDKCNVYNSSYVIESYCDKDGTVSVGAMPCPVGLNCVNGACVLRKSTTSTSSSRTD